MGPITSKEREVFPIDKFQMERRDLVYDPVPFTPSDLCYWKAYTQGLKADSERLITLMRAIFTTHNSTEAESQTLPFTLLI
jgi:hypothetical protein